MPLTLASAERRSYAAPIVVAAIVLVLAIGAAFWFNPHHTADLTATRTDIFAPVTTFKPVAGKLHVIGQKPATEQDLYAVVTLHLQNDLRLPIFIDEVDGSYDAAKGGELTAVAPATNDLDRMEQVFPQLKPMMPHPLLLGDTVAPKSSVDGQVVFHFAGLTADDWKTRKPSTLTLHFAHQDPITINMP